MTNCQSTHFLVFYYNSNLYTKKVVINQWCFNARPKCGEKKILIFEWIFYNTYFCVFSELYYSLAHTLPFFIILPSLNWAYTVHLIFPRWAVYITCAKAFNYQSALQTSWRSESWASRQYYTRIWWFFRWDSFTWSSLSISFAIIILQFSVACAIYHTLYRPRWKGRVHWFIAENKK